MTHYVDDLAVFGHVMGAATDWGSEVHHSDYEEYVNARTSTYASELTAFLAFDGDLYPRDPYDAALLLAFDTTFGEATGRNATWMDCRYDWSSSEFRSRASESINLAVNYLADVLHGFWLAASKPVPEFQTPLVTLVVGIIVVFLFSPHLRSRRLIRGSYETHRRYCSQFPDFVATAQRTAHYWQFHG